MLPSTLLLSSCAQTQCLRLTLQELSFPCACLGSSKGADAISSVTEITVERLVTPIAPSSILLLFFPPGLD